MAALSAAPGPGVLDLCLSCMPSARPIMWAVRKACSSRACGDQERVHFRLHLFSKMVEKKTGDLLLLLVLNRGRALALLLLLTTRRNVKLLLLADPYCCYVITL